MKKLTLVLITFLISSLGWAQLDVKVNPSQPVKQETFNIIFEITTTENVDPQISFNPNGIEILGRSKEVSLSTSIINGQFSSTRKIKVIYEAVVEKPRVYFINNIRVDIDGKELKHNPVRIPVLNRKKKASAMFLRAEVTKKTIYIGEGIDVRYYLYSRVPVVQTEFKSFPKLDGFIKRFHKVDEREETVEVDGQIYRRSLKYSARIYAEKAGKMYIDPLRLNIQYASSRGNPFGSFGLSFNRFRSKSVNSPKEEIKVLPLPAENVPLNFTGLVGEHDFKFTSTKSKYVVNEAIEAKLEVVGPGALEKMNAPILYQDAALEQFDTKSDFIEIGRSSGRKVFDYTFLARADVEIPARLLKLAYFDPTDKTYKEKSVEISSLTIGGGGVPIVSPGLNNNNNTSSEGEVASSKPDFNYGMAAPLFEESWGSIPLNWPKLILISFSILVFIQCLELFLRSFRSSQLKNNIDGEIKRIKKEGMNYSLIANLIYRLHPEAEDVSLREVIDSSNLPSKDKKYFLEVVDTLEKKTFALNKEGERGVKRRVAFRQSAFNSLKKEIANERI
ncbi:MAG: BatD family protein [Halobacteriovoraceae bacterium]|nr:BatD family protein [Halobacteriovoraceae bacterium]